MKYDHCAGASLFPNDIQVHPCKYLVTVMLNQFKVVLLLSKFFGTQTVLVVSHIVRLHLELVCIEFWTQLLDFHKGQKSHHGFFFFFFFFLCVRDSVVSS